MCYEDAIPPTIQNRLQSSFYRVAMLGTEPVHAGTRQQRVRGQPGTFAGRSSSIWGLGMRPGEDSSKTVFRTVGLALRGRGEPKGRVRGIGILTTLDLAVFHWHEIKVHNSRGERARPGTRGHQWHPKSCPKA